MTHVSCPSCRLRFSPTLAVHLAECPLCGNLLDRTTAAAPTLGLWLFDADSSEPQGAPRAAADASPALAAAAAMAVPAKP